MLKPTHSRRKPASTERDFNALRLDFNALRRYVRRKAALADKSSKEWGGAGGDQQSAHWAGQGYAYRKVERWLGPIETKNKKPK